MRTESAQLSGNGLSAESGAHHVTRVEAEVLTAIELDDDHVQTVIERGVEESSRDTREQRVRRCRDDLRLTSAVDPRQQARLIVAAQIAGGITG